METGFIPLIFENPCTEIMSWRSALNSSKQPVRTGLRVLGVAVRQRLADHGVLAWE